MTATADGGSGGAAEAELDGAYFRAVEDAFVRLRGAPLLLSPADFQVASRWRRDGVPLALVVATLEEVFARRQERGTRGRINSLRYCAPAVEQAWSELREIQGPMRREPAEGEGEGGPELDRRLEELAASLPASVGARDGVAARILALRGQAAEEVEEALRALDAEVLGAAEAALEAPARERLAAEVEAIVDGLRDRFPDDELVALRGQLRRQRLRRLVGLPTLTLF